MDQKLGSLWLKAVDLLPDGFCGFCEFLKFFPFFFLGFVEGVLFF